MNKINDAVSLIVENNPIHALMVKSGVCNNTSLARRIKPSVDAMLGKDVKLNSIVKAISGLKPDESWDRQLEFLRSSNLTLEYRHSEREGDVESLKLDNFVLGYRDMGHIRIVERDVHDGNLACIRIRLPENASGVPGLSLFVVQYLMIQRHPVDRIYRLGREIMLICSTEEAEVILRHLSRLMFSREPTS